MIDPAGKASGLPSSLKTRLYISAFYLWLNGAIAAVGGLVFWAVAARLYSAHDVGLGSAAFSALVLLATFSHFGLGLGLIRFLPEYGSGASRLANAAFTTTAAAAAVLAIAFLVGAWLWLPDVDFLLSKAGYFAAFILFTV
ncbi:MAG: hypothetical protein ACREUU_04265, partial [Gammaproteobacteria bacterium]